MSTSTANDLPMDGVTEYCEGLPVHLAKTSGTYTDPTTPSETWLGHGRLCVQAQNEGGHNCTQVDLIELLVWFRRHQPDLLAKVMRGDL